MENQHAGLLPEGETMNRRNFMKTFSVLPVLTGMATISLCSGGCSDESPADVALTGAKVTLVLANEPTLQAVNGFIRRSFGTNNGGNPVIVVRTAEKNSVLCPACASTRVVPCRPPVEAKPHAAAMAQSLALAKVILVQMWVASLLLHYSNS
jgi:hypothetical protein